MDPNMHIECPNEVLIGTKKECKDTFNDQSELEKHP
jgi:hypothetical protein